MTFSKLTLACLTSAVLATSLGVVAEARADYQVFCPASMVGTWGGSAAGNTSTIPIATEQANPGGGDTTDLVCKYDFIGGLSAQSVDDGQCIGTIRFSGVNAVFGRTEGFVSGVFGVIGFADQGSCFFTFEREPPPFLLRVTEACSPNGDGRSWTCPDNAFPVFQP